MPAPRSRGPAPTPTPAATPAPAPASVAPAPTAPVPAAPTTASTPGMDVIGADEAFRALQLPDDLRNDLLASQAASIQTPIALTRVKIMPQGVNLFEFDDRPGRTTNEFAGIVLGYHLSNVLWDRAFGTRPDPTNPQASLPACSSRDGNIGRPREGFAHAALGGRVADGSERISCATCPYNQWESAQLLGKPGRGKATTNQRNLIIWVADDDERVTPVELVLPPTSLVAFDEYLGRLLQRGMPIQALVTHFRLEGKERNGLRWSQATFTPGTTVDRTTFTQVLTMREQFMRVISPNTEPPTPQVARDPEVGATVVGQDEEVDAPPF